MSAKLLQKISTWDENAARHILSRTLLGFTKDDVVFALSKTLDDFVDNYLLKDQPLPSAPQYNSIDWTTQPDNSTINVNYTNWYYSLVYWWYNLMINQGYSFKEKMVLFLHNHFTTQFSTVRIPQILYAQNQLYRQNVFGDFKDLTKKVTIAPAMLYYLNGAQNVKTVPNENYARELMELFTLGIGNYTEDDIHAAARALAGWKIINDGKNPITSSFVSANWDSTSKTFLGQTGNWTYTDIVDIIFDHKDTDGNPVAAQFICKKLYKEFVYYNPDPTVDLDGANYIVQLANLFVSSKYVLKPVLSALLKSQYFHSDKVRGSRIKPPVEFLLSTLKQFSIVPDANNDIFGYIRSQASSLQQVLFDPPDVRGWQGQRKWISTITYPTRNTFTDNVVNGYKINQTTLKISDPIKYARSFSSSEIAVNFVNDVAAQLIQFPISDQKKQEFLSIMLDGAAVYDWTTYYSNTTEQQAITKRLQKFLIALMRSPEFQLS